MTRSPFQCTSTLSWSAEAHLYGRTVLEELVQVVGFLVKGINETLPSLAMFYFCKDDLKEDPAT